MLRCILLMAVRLSGAVPRAPSSHGLGESEQSQGRVIRRTHQARNSVAVGREPVSDPARGSQSVLSMLGRSTVSEVEPGAVVMLEKSRSNASDILNYFPDTSDGSEDEEAKLNEYWEIPELTLLTNSLSQAATTANEASIMARETMKVMRRAWEPIGYTESIGQLHDLLNETSGMALDADKTSRTAMKLALRALDKVDETIASLHVEDKLAILGEAPADADVRGYTQTLGGADLGGTASGEHGDVQEANQHFPAEPDDGGSSPGAVNEVAGEASGLPTPGTQGVGVAPVHGAEETSGPPLPNADGPAAADAGRPAHPSADESNGYHPDAENSKGHPTQLLSVNAKRQALMLQKWRSTAASTKRSI